MKKGRRCLAQIDDGPLSLTPRCGIMGPNRPYSKARGLHKGCLYVFALTFVDCRFSHQHRRSSS